MKVYRVEFYIKRGIISNHFIYLQAKSQKEAIERARALWTRSSHMFRISAKCSELPLNYKLDFFYLVRTY